MTVAIVANPTSGKGKARGHSKQLAQAFFRRNIKYREYEFGPAARQNSAFDPDAFEGARALIACGGDGTVNALAPACLRTDTPIYHFPSGNACLFARNFKMIANPNRAVRAVEAGETLGMDLWEATSSDTDTPDGMTIIAGLGPDAGVVRRFHERRDGPAGNGSYVIPVLAELLRPSLPVFTVTVDGVKVAEQTRGWVLIANLRSYALRLDPCLHALPSDGKLDLALLPCTSAWRALIWAWRCRWGRQFRRPEAVKAIGSEIIVESDEPAPLEIDGEYLGASTRWRFSRTNKPLPVLIPPAARKR